MVRPIAKPTVAPLGTGLRLFRWRTLAWALVALLGLLALDQAVSLHQRTTLEERQKARARLERAALFNLRADVADLAFGPDGGYRLTIYLDTPFPERLLYVMAPSVQAYVQVGTVWREVPTRPAIDLEGRVLKLTERRTFDYVIEPNIKEFEQLIPGYMHVRFSNVMLVSQRAEPERDIVERTDNYYVYLRPHGAKEQALVRKNQFPGGRAPLWIPMPPH